MALANEDFQEIGEFVRKNLSQWLSDQSLAKPPHVYEIELRERMVRVEEELKNQRELMKQGFEKHEKRFDQQDKRFELINRRIDSFMIWSFGLSVTLLAVIIIGVLKLT